MKQLLKQIAFSTVNALSPKDKTGGIILMYHSISDSKAFFAVTADTFDMQMRLLKSSGRECLKFSELAERLASGQSIRNTACVTFDDGYEDNFTTALPILQKYSIPASVFIATGSMGKSRTTSQGDQLKVMDQAMVKQLIRSDLIECLPHGHDHKRMSQLDIDSAIKEVSSSIAAVVAITERPAPYFAYPFGDHSSDTVSILERQGFKGAVTVEEGVVTSSSKSLELPRMALTRETSVPEFISKISHPKAYLSIKRIFKR